MKKKQLLLLLLLLLSLLLYIVIVVTELGIENVVYTTELEKTENIKIKEIPKSETENTRIVEKEKIVSKISWEDNRDVHMYVVEPEPERLKKLIKGITSHSELSAAEKQYTIASIQNIDNCPLDCLGGYSEYKKEFEEKHPSGIDPETNYTFEELINYHASYGKRVREELEKDKVKDFFMS